MSWSSCFTCEFPLLSYQCYKSVLSYLLYIYILNVNLDIKVRYAACSGATISIFHSQACSTTPLPDMFCLAIHQCLSELLCVFQNPFIKTIHVYFILGWALFYLTINSFVLKLCVIFSVFGKVGSNLNICILKQERSQYYIYS